MSNLAPEYIGMTIVAQEYERCAKMPRDAYMIKTYHDISTHKRIAKSAVKSITYCLDAPKITEYTTDAMEYYPRKSNAVWEDIGFGVKQAHTTAPPLNDRNMTLFQTDVLSFVFMCERKNIRN